MEHIWWFYLYWMPTYLNSQRGFDLKGIAMAIPIIYIIATIMGFIGGWFPGYLMEIGWSVQRARKTTMLVSAALLPFSVFAVFSDSAWTAILLVSLACGAHNSWSANIFTMCSDCFRSEDVGSVTGIAGNKGMVDGQRQGAARRYADAASRSGRLVAGDRTVIDIQIALVGNDPATGRSGLGRVPRDGAADQSQRAQQRSDSPAGRVRPGGRIPRDRALPDRCLGAQQSDRAATGPIARR